MARGDGRADSREEFQAQRRIGLAVRRLRARDDLTQEQLARRAGISYQYLCGIEQGKENFSIGILERIAAALEVPLAALVAVAYGESASIGFARQLRATGLGPSPA